MVCSVLVALLGLFMSVLSAVIIFAVVPSDDPHQNVGLALLLATPTSVIGFCYTITAVVGYMRNALFILRRLKEIVFG